MFIRNAEKSLIAWSNGAKRAPLVVTGARQVGKTTIIEKFAKDRFAQVHRINFEKARELHSIFDQDLDPKRILRALSLAQQTTISPNRDMLFFDEIQECPLALTSLKYFAEDLPELALCSAGSLLGVSLSENSFPVGKVERMEIFPLCFSEFLRAVGEDALDQALRDLEPACEISISLHRRLWERFKQHLVTGGLPEVIQLFISNGLETAESRAAVRKMQSGLVKDYLADMAKHCGSVNALHLDRVFSAVANQLGAVHDGSVQRFKFRGVVPGISQYSRLVTAFDWLSRAGLILRVPVVRHAQIPLSSVAKESQFKSYLFDVGILGAMLMLEPESILQYDFGSYKGFLIENFLAQEFRSQDLWPLYSWQDNAAEIEFLLTLGAEPIPVEAKAGTVTRSRSLESYFKRYHPAKRVLASAKPYWGQSSSVNPFMLPLYAAGLLKGRL